MRRYLADMDRLTGQRGINPHLDEAVKGLLRGLDADYFTDFYFAWVHLL